MKSCLHYKTWDEKHVGVFCRFDVGGKTWECMPSFLMPKNSIIFSLIGFSNCRLVLIRLVADAKNVDRVRIWEVDPETFQWEKHFSIYYQCLTHILIYVLY